MTVLSVSHKCRDSLILSLTDLRQPCLVLFGYQPKNGTRSLHHGCSLVLLLLLCFSSPLCQFPFYSTGPGPDSLTVPSNGPWHIEAPAHLRTAGVLTGYSHDLTPFCPLNGHLPADSHTQGGLDQRDRRRKGTALFSSQIRCGCSIGVHHLVTMTQQIQLTSVGN